jgi:hypothetical protein
VVLDGFLIVGFVAGLVGEALLFLINKYNPMAFFSYYHN